jgi:hypothetical protein
MFFKLQLHAFFWTKVDLQLFLFFAGGALGIDLICFAAGFPYFTSIRGHGRHQHYLVNKYVVSVSFGLA